MTKSNPEKISKSTDFQTKKNNQDQDIRRNPLEDQDAKEIADNPMVIPQGPDQSSENLRGDLYKE